MQICTAEISVDEYDLIAQNGQADTQIRGQYGFTGSTFSTGNRPDLFVQLKPIQQYVRGVF